MSIEEKVRELYEKRGKILEMGREARVQKQHEKGKLAAREDPGNFILMHAMGPNVAGVIGTAVAAGVLLSVLG